MKVVELSKYPDVNTSKPVWTVLINANPILKPTEDEGHASALANAHYHNYNGPAQLKFWDGFKREVTILEERKH